MAGRASRNAKLRTIKPESRKAIELPGFPLLPLLLTVNVVAVPFVELSGVTGVGASERSSSAVAEDIQRKRLTVPLKPQAAVIVTVEVIDRPGDEMVAQAEIRRGRRLRLLNGL
jgi:hypothetical protein